MKPVEGGRLLQQLGSGRGHQLLFEIRDALVKRQIEEDLDKADQIAAPATAVAVEQILADVDVEGGASVAVQGTEADELLLACGGATCPVALLQIIQQRNALFEMFQILHPVWKYQARTAGKPEGCCLQDASRRGDWRREPCRITICAAAKLLFAR